jgi:hypothetical protein
MTLAFVGFALFSLVLSMGSGIEVFLTLILIGLLIVRELTDSFTPVRIKERIDIFVYAFIALFVVIVSRRIWEILA